MPAPSRETGGYDPGINDAPEPHLVKAVQAGVGEGSFENRDKAKMHVPGVRSGKQSYGSAARNHSMTLPTEGVGPLTVEHRAERRERAVDGEEGVPHRIEIHAAGLRSRFSGADPTHM